MNRFTCSLAASMLVAAIVLPDNARADGGNFAAGLFGGLVAGAIVGSAIAPRQPVEPIYVAPEPYYPEPVCFGRQQVFDPYYRVYRWRQVQVPCY